MYTLLLQTEFDAKTGSISTLPTDPGKGLGCLAVSRMGNLDGSSLLKISLCAGPSQGWLEMEMIAADHHLCFGCLKRLQLSLAGLKIGFKAG